MALMTRNDQKEPRGRRWVEDDAPGNGADAEQAEGRKGRRSGKAGKEAKSGKKDKGVKGEKSTQVAEPLTPTLPSTNLLPPTVSQRAHAQQLQRRFAVGAAVAVAAIGATYVLQSGSISGANAELETEQARTTQLAGEVRALAPVKLFYATLDANRTTIQDTMSREVLLSGVLKRLYGSAPEGVDLETIDVTVDSAPLAAGAATAGTAGAAAPAATALTDCPSPDPYAAPEERAGCITIAGTAVSRERLGAWEARLGRSQFFEGLFISDTQAVAATDGAGTGAGTGDTAGDGPEAITFAATISVTAKAYSLRYADPEFLEGTTR